MKAQKHFLFAPLCALLLCSLFFTVRCAGQTMQVFDQNGRRYADSELVLPDNVIPLNIDTTTAGFTQIYHLNSVGYFNVYCSQGSGFEPGAYMAAERLAVLDSVLVDVSRFIHSPLATNGNRVVLFLDNLGAFSPSPGTVASGASFFITPNAGPGIATRSNGLQGIVDNTTWLTITTGKDAYTGTLLPPVSSTNPLIINPKPYPHATMGFNFGIDSFHTDLATLSDSNEYDLYTIALHELTHALGFLSLIDARGWSRFNSPYATSPSYYNFSRYDLRLKTAGGVPLITTDATCRRYNANFNAAITGVSGAYYGDGTLKILAPDSAHCYFDSTVCSTAIQYVGSVTKPVYTPNCFDEGGSLSHFEDECRSPNSNNTYYVMSNINGKGSSFCKRAYTPEERQVLCDLGYSVDTIFGSTTRLNLVNYHTSTCPGTSVAGTNDGLTDDGFYFKYVTDLGKPIRVTNVLKNDTGADRMDCLELAVGDGSITNVTSNSFTYTPSATQGDEIHILRYIPTNASTGIEGNITYVFIKVINGNCASCHVPGASNMVSNPGFESGSGCGKSGHSVDNTLMYMACWTDYEHQASRSGTCATTTAHGGSYYLQMYGTSGDPGSMINVLNRPLISGSTYAMTFWTRCASASGSCRPANILRLSAAPAMPLPYTWSSFSYTAPDIKLLKDTALPLITIWTKDSLVFTVPAGSSPTYYSYLIFTSIGGDFDVDDINLTQIGTPPTFSSASSLLGYYNWRAHDTLSTPNAIDITGSFDVDTNLNLKNCPNVICATNSDITVRSGKTLTLSSGTVVRGDCNGQLWKGIITHTGNPANVIIDSSEIHSMSQGVHITGSNTLSCKNSFFIDNLRGLYLDGIPGSLSNIENNNFYSEDTNFISGSVGVLAYDCHDATLGNISNGAGNSFHELGLGIKIDYPKTTAASGNIRVYNGNFYNIFGGVYTANLPVGNPANATQPQYISSIYADSVGCAIYADDHNTTLVATNMNKLTVNYTTGNTGKFHDCDKNIILSGMSADVQNAIIDRGWGIMCGRADAGTYNMLHNMIDNVITGIYVIGNVKSGVIQYNRITSSVAGLFGYSPNIGMYPICVQQFTSSGSNRFLIADDTIGVNANGGTGIRFMSANVSDTIAKNYIHLQTSNNTYSLICGIGITNSNGTKILGNHIDGSGGTLGAPNATVAATDIALCSQIQLICNHLLGTQYGFIVEGNCRTDSMNIKSNTFDTHETGIYLRPFGAEGSLGNIGDSSHDNDNSFVGTYGSGVQIYTFSNCLTSSQNIISSGLSILTGGNNASCKYTLRSNGGRGKPSSCTSIGYPIANPHGTGVIDVAYAENIASGLITYGDHQPGSDWLDQLSIFEQLRNDATTKASSSILNSFYVSNLGSALDYIGRIDVMLDTMLNASSTGEFITLLQTAKDTNAAMPLPNQQATNEQAINTIYLKYVTGGLDTLTTQDSTDIAAMALQCPLDGGRAVFKARSMYAIYNPMLVYEDMNLCGIGYKRPLGTAAIPQHEFLKLYPNPVNDVLNIEYSRAGLLELTDLMGRKLRSVTLTNAQGGKTLLNLAGLPAGICICRYIVNGQLKEVRKITLLHE